MLQCAFVFLCRPSGMTNLQIPFRTRTGSVKGRVVPCAGQKAWDRGCKLRAQGRLEEAAKQFRQAVQLEPGNALYRIVLAHSEEKLGHWREALLLAEGAFEIDHSSMLACRLYVALLLDQSRYTEAIQVLDRLAASTPRDVEWHLQKAHALIAIADFPRAVRESSIALSLAGNDVKLRTTALVRMATSFQNIELFPEAALCYRMLLDVQPDSLVAAVNAVHASSFACDWQNLMIDIEALQRSIDLLRRKGGLVAQDVSPFGLITATDDPILQRWMSEVAFNYKAALVSGRDISEVPMVDSLCSASGRYRIGLLSGDFHLHATMILIVEMLESFDKDIFEIYIYSNGRDDQSDMRRRAEAVANCWREIGEMTSENVARQIREDGVAFLLEMKGYTLSNRIEVTAFRAAPIQISWLGYPGTTGASCIDYVIGDQFVTPLDAQAGYTECIAQMPHCYQPNDSGRTLVSRSPRADCGLPSDVFVFASFNAPYKLIPEMFEAWCRILVATPGSVLWLLVRKEDTRQRLLRVAEGHGVVPERIIFAPMLMPEAHRARIGNADLFLDSFPCGGHTTASDALWAGVPVLTLYGRSFASRVAASLLHTLDLPELACSDIDDYMREAVRLASDPAALADLKERLQQARITSPLFDGRRYARDFERLLLRMAARHEAGLPPAPLAAEVIT
jgi:predicted O-linked N-acetylglucosamine transferase (SPINDLY family)